MADETKAHDAGRDDTHVDNPASLFLIFALVGGLSVVNLIISMAGLENPVQLVAQLAVATLQAVIVARSFMHLKGADTVTWLTVGSAIFFMAIMFTLILSDMLSRQYGSL